MQNNLSLCMESGIQLNISDILNANNINEAARSELINLLQREGKAQSVIDFFHLLYQTEDPNAKKHENHTNPPSNILIHEALSPIHRPRAEDFTNRRLFSANSSATHPEDYISLLSMKKVCFRKSPVIMC